MAYTREGGWIEVFTKKDIIYDTTQEDFGRTGRFAKVLLNSYFKEDRERGREILRRMSIELHKHNQRLLNPPKKRKKRS